MRHGSGHQQPHSSMAERSCVHFEWDTMVEATREGARRTGAQDVECATLCGHQGHGYDGNVSDSQ